MSGRYQVMGELARWLPGAGSVRGDAVVFFTQGHLGDILHMVWFVHTYHTDSKILSGWQIVREAVPNRSIAFMPFYERLKRFSWRIGDGLERWAGRYYGSNWARTLPVWTEAKILSRLPWRKEPYPVHFLFGEFLSPKDVRPYHRRGARVLVTVHATPWRWDRVWQRPDGFANADLVVVTSNSQKVKVLEHVPEERIVRIRQGFRADEWTPALNRGERGGRLRLFMFGNTDRDHEFAAAVARALPKEKFELRVRTGSPVASLFADCPCVTLLPYLSDAQIHEEYRQADLMFMPMKDSAFNRVMLNAMACGTPVAVNNIGGVEEYVDGGCNFLLFNNHSVEEWVENSAGSKNAGIGWRRCAPKSGNGRKTLIGPSSRKNIWRPTERRWRCENKTGCPHDLDTGALQDRIRLRGRPGKNGTLRAGGNGACVGKG